MPTTFEHEVAYSYYGTMQDYINFHGGSNFLPFPYGGTIQIINEELAVGDYIVVFGGWIGQHSTGNVFDTTATFSGGGAQNGGNVYTSITPNSFISPDAAPFVAVFACKLTQALHVGDKISLNATSQESSIGMGILKFSSQTSVVPLTQNNGQNTPSLGGPPHTYSTWDAQPSLAHSTGLSVSLPTLMLGGVVAYAGPGGLVATDPSLPSAPQFDIHSDVSFYGLGDTVIAAGNPVKCIVTSEQAHSDFGGQYIDFVGVMQMYYRIGPASVAFSCYGPINFTANYWGASCNTVRATEKLSDLVSFARHPISGQMFAAWTDENQRLRVSLVTDPDTNTIATYVPATPTYTSTFTSPTVDATNGELYPKILIREDGTIWVFYLSTSDSKIKYVRSKNYGSTWSSPVTIVTNTNYTCPTPGLSLMGDFVVLMFLDKTTSPAKWRLMVGVGQTDGTIVWTSSSDTGLAGSEVSGTLHQRKGGTWEFVYKDDSNNLVIKRTKLIKPDGTYNAWA